MAPSIVNSTFYSSLGSSLGGGGTTWQINSGGGTGDGYVLIVATNNGVIPSRIDYGANAGTYNGTGGIFFQQPFQGTLLWVRTGTGSNGETWTISAWLAPFVWNQGNFAADSGSDGGGVITVNFNGVPDGCCAALLTVTGMGYGANSPLGPNIPIQIMYDRGVLDGPVTFSGSSKTDVVNLQWSTVTWNTLNMAIMVSTGSIGGSSPVGFTSVGSSHIFGTNYMQLVVGTKTTTGAVVASASFSWNFTGVPMLAVEMSLTDATGIVSGGSIVRAINASSKLPGYTRLIIPTIGL